MIPVILGVLIALFINDWKDGVDDERFVKRVLASIKKEMKANKQEFEEVLEKQYALADTLEFYSADDSIPLIEVVNKANGVQIPTVKNTSWRSVLNSKLELIDFEVISQMTEIENAKQYLRIKTEKLIDYGSDNAISTDAETKKVFLLLLENLINSEEGLLEGYETYLKKGID